MHTNTFIRAGDVDSCDDNEEDDDDSRKMPLSQRMRNRRTNNLNKNRIHSPFNNMSPNIITQQQKQQYQNNSYSNLRGGGGGGSGSGVSGKVNNLDLINGCIDNRYEHDNAGNSRQGRRMMYGRNAFVNSRHETKLWTMLIKLISKILNFSLYFLIGWSIHPRIFLTHSFKILYF